jgi:fluoride exporter
MLTKYFLIGVCGLAGVFCRYFLNTLFAHSTFPIGTLAVNLIGSFLIGFATVACIGTVSDALRLAILTGFLGGFTTFSAFSLDAVQLFSDGQNFAGGMYLALSVGGGIGALCLGLVAARTIFS